MGIVASSWGTFLQEHEGHSLVLRDDVAPNPGEAVLICESCMVGMSVDPKDMPPPTPRPHPNKDTHQ